MKLLLLIFVLQLICLPTFSKVYKYDVAKQLLHARKEQLIKAEPEFKSIENPPAGPFCQKLVAYIVGTFQRRDATFSNFTAQFEVRLDADLKKKRIIVESNDWNETFSNSRDFNLDFYYSGSYQWCDIKEDDCSASFSKNVTTFRMDLNKRDGTFFHLLYFPYFNNSFSLSRPRDKCTKHQLDGLNDEYTPDLDELSICVCCDEYKPSVLLTCPEDPWHDDVSPPKSTPTPVPAVSKTTTYLPPTGNINCTSITAYYNGRFSDDYDDMMNVEFQVRMTVDADSQQIYYIIDHWNEDQTRSSNIFFYGYNNAYSHICFPPINNNCSFSYVTGTESYIFLELYHLVYDNGISNYDFMYFPSFENRFSLYNAVGQCTKYQPNLDWMVNPALYDFCMCCGEYNPHFSLKCPQNPWAKRH